MKKLLIALGLGGVVAATVGIAVGGRRKRLIRKTANMIDKEANRLQRNINKDHLKLSLERLNADQLKLLYNWLEAYEQRDRAALELLSPRVVASMGEVIESSPDWQIYRPVIFNL